MTMLIVFCSDNGPHCEGGADPDFFNSNGIYRGYKRDLYEGGIRVPFIASWPGHITPREDNTLFTFWDMMPTFAALTDTPVKNTCHDGISLLPTLTGKVKELERIILQEHTFDPNWPLLHDERQKLSK